MNPLLLAPILEMGQKAIERLFPDKEAQRKAEAEYLLLLQEQDFKKVIAQLEVNAREAQHPTIFVAGWRPFVGWVCGFGFAYATVVHNLLEWVSLNHGWQKPPAIDTEILVYVLCALLGVSGMRSWEKKQGIATK